MSYIGKTPTSVPLTSSDITDGIISTAKIANDAATLAKMAQGTDGNLISYDASGNPVAVATGNAGQVLTSAGAGSPPTFATGGVTGKTIRAVSVVQDNTNYNHTGQGFTNFGSGLSYTPATTSSQVMAFIDVVVSAYSSSADNDARTPFKFGTDNASGSTIYESTNAGNNIGYTNINDPTIYGGLSATIGTCQRNGSNNVVVKIGCVSNQDAGTIINLFHQKVVFMEIE